SVQRPGPGSLQQSLGEPGLRIGPRSFSDVPKTDGEEEDRQHDERTGSGLNQAHANHVRTFHSSHANTRVVNPIKRCNCPFVAPFASSSIETLSSLFAWLAGWFGSMTLSVGRAGVTSTATRLVYLLTR